MYAAILTNIIDLAHAISGCLAFGVLAALTYGITKRNTMPNDFDPPPAAGTPEQSFARLSPAILREVRYMSGPHGRIALLRKIVEQCKELRIEAGEELYKLQSTVEAKS